MNQESPGFSRGSVKFPREFGHYRLEALLGVGGMSEVYRALDTRRDREVALKLLPEALSGDRDYVERFRRESYVAARLREPHVIPIHDFGEIDGRLFIDMRLVDGRDIAQLLAVNGALPSALAVDLITQIAQALDAAHAEGLVHRDIKPANVLVTEQNFVYVVDFGIARSIGSPQRSLTVTGPIVGTLDYMAPERFANLGVDSRSDVYSLACLLYQCLAATRPFDGEDLPSLMYAHLHAEPPRPSRLVADVPAALDEVVARGMAKQPADRFPTAGALAAAAAAAVGSAPTAVTAAAVGLVPAPAPIAWEEPPPTATVASRTELIGGAAGLAPANSSQPTVSPRPQPGFPDPAGTLTQALAPGAGPAPPPPAASEPPKPHRGLLAPLLSVIVIAVLVTLLVTFVRSQSPGATTATGADGGNGSTASGDSPASIPTPTLGSAIRVSKAPAFIEVAPNGRFAYITNREVRMVTAFDTRAKKVIAKIPVPEGPSQFVSFSPDGRQAYVSVFDTVTDVSVIAFVDTETSAVTTTVPVGRGPSATSTTPDGRLLYVPCHDDGRLDVIDVATAAPVTQIPVPANPDAVVFGADGRYAYVASRESNLVTVLDAATNEVVAQVPVGASPHSIAVSPDGGRLAVVNIDSNDVSLIDTATDTVVAVVPVGMRPQDVAYATDGRFFYVANLDDDTVSVVDATTNQVTAVLQVGPGPSSIAVSPQGRQAYVTNVDDGTVRILDITGP